MMFATMNVKEPKPKAFAPLADDFLDRLDQRAEALEAQHDTDRYGLHTRSARAAG